MWNFRLAQARTGTGKTLAFLIPVLQNIINYDPKLERRGYRPPRASPEDIRAIIISPTRELAEQIAVEAQKLTQHTGVIIQTAVGGSQKALGLRRIKTEGCHILIGTPGRLKDILSDPYSRVRAPNLSAFVLDEADRLLDQGFGPEIQEIQTLLPNRSEVDRQTLLFSATVPREVLDIVRQTTKPNMKFVRTVQEGEQQTHEKVPQKVSIVRGFENQMPALLELCKREIAGQSEMPFKAIVYFGATADVNLAAETFRNLKSPGSSIYEKHPLAPATIVEMHARLNQGQRTKAADMFRNAKSAIMFSSDVTARGMDFPNVTHVIQVGLPSTRDIYIHRIGRTARGDKKGEGWLILTDLESREGRQRLYNLPLYEDRSLQAAQIDMSHDAQIPEHLATSLTQVIDASRAVSLRQKVAAYLASLGVYQWAPREYLIDSLNRRAKYCWGMETPPNVPAGLASKLGLNRVRGVNIGHNGIEDGEGGYSPSRQGGRDSYGGGGGGVRRSFDSSGYGSRSTPFDRSDRGEDRGFRSDGDRRSSSGGFRSSYGGGDSGRGSSYGRSGSGSGSSYGAGSRYGDRAGGYGRGSQYDRTDRSGSFAQSRN